MVTVQMTYQDQIDRLRFNLHALHRAQDGGSGLHQNSIFTALQQIARLKPAVTGESIAGTKKTDIDRAGSRWGLAHRPRVISLGHVRDQRE